MSQTYDPFSEERRPRLGVLGASRIVEGAISNVAQDLFEVSALAARDEQRARQFARKQGIPRAYGSYEQLLTDSEIDVVYVAVPCAHHAPLAELALSSGKHVLCEKPFSLDADSAKSCVELSERSRRLLMEAHHWRYHPLLPSFAQALGRLGSLRSMTATFVVGLNNPGDIRKKPALGAGVTLDFGCYLLQWARFVARVCGDEQTVEIRSASMIQEAEGIDVTADIVASLGPAEAQLHCDMRDGIPFSAMISVEGDEGRVLFDNPLGVEGSAIVETPRGAERVVTTPSRVAERGSTYRRQLEALREALRTGEPPPTSGRDIIETMRLLDDAYRLAGLPSRRDLALGAGGARL